MVPVPVFSRAASSTLDVLPVAFIACEAVLLACLTSDGAACWLQSKRHQPLIACPLLTLAVKPDCSWPAGMVYCMDYLASNLDWLQEKLEALQAGKLHDAVEFLPS